MGKCQKWQPNHQPANISWFPKKMVPKNDHALPLNKDQLNLVGVMMTVPQNQWIRSSPRHGLQPNIICFGFSCTSESLRIANLRADLGQRSTGLENPWRDPVFITFPSSSHDPGRAAQVAIRPEHCPGDFESRPTGLAICGALLTA